MVFYKSFLLLGSIISLLLGLFIYYCGRKKLSSILLSFYNLFVSIWFFGQYMGERVLDKDSVLFWTRINISAALAIPVLFLHFIYAFLGIENEKRALIRFGYFTTFLLYFFIPTRYFIQDINKTQYFRYFPQGGIVYSFFALVFLLFVFLGFYELIRAFLLSNGIKKNQISYILLASVIGFGGGVWQFLPVFGVNVYPFGIFIVPFYAFIAAYAILKHRLFDIKIVLKKGFAYSILVGLFSGLYIISIYVLWKTFEWASGFRSQAAAVFTLLCFAVLFDPLREKIIGILNSLFDKDSYDYKSIFNKISSSISLSIDKEKIIGIFAAETIKAMNLSAIAVFLFDEEKNNFVLEKEIGFNGINKLIELIDISDGNKNGKNSFLPCPLPLATLSECMIIDELEDNNPIKKLKDYGVSIIVPLIVKGLSKGVMLIGEKKSQDMWNSEDCSFLMAISAHLATVIENVSLHEKVLKTQKKLFQSEKLSALGQVAAQAAHEIKNPLTSIKGMAQVMESRLDDKDFLKEFSDIAVRQINRIDAVISNLLKLGKRREEADISKNNKIENIQINGILEEIIKLVKIECEKKGIKIAYEKEGIIRVKAIKEQIFDAFFNIILNAEHAMTEGGILSIRTSNDAIIISDTGIGIKREHINKIFDPFFSTKPNGSGLGLSTAYKIIYDCGGVIEVESKEGEGTVFRVRFGNSPLSPLLEREGKDEQSESGVSC